MVAQEFSVSSYQLSEKDGAPAPPRLFGGGRRSFQFPVISYQKKMAPRRRPVFSAGGV
jgi:hypothetical protein